MAAVLGAPGADLTARDQQGFGILHIAASNWGPAGGGAAAALGQRAPLQQRWQPAWTSMRRLGLRSGQRCTWRPVPAHWWGHRSCHTPTQSEPRREGAGMHSVLHVPVFSSQTHAHSPAHPTHLPTQPPSHPLALHISLQDGHDALTLAAVNCDAPLAGLLLDDARTAAVPVRLLETAIAEASQAELRVRVWCAFGWLDALNDPSATCIICT